MSIVHRAIKICDNNSLLHHDCRSNQQEVPTTRSAANREKLIDTALKWMRVLPAGFVVEQLQFNNITNEGKKVPSFKVCREKPRCQVQGSCFVLRIIGMR